MEFLTSRVRIVYDIGPQGDVDGCKCSAHSNTVLLSVKKQRNTSGQAGDTQTDAATEIKTSLYIQSQRSTFKMQLKFTVDVSFQCCPLIDSFNVGNSMVPY